MLTSVAAWSRYQRDSMLEVLHTDYVRTARAKGVPRRQVIRRHALRNALIPFVTVVAIDAGVLLGGVVVVERVFSWPGLGLLFFDALEAFRLPGDPGVDGGGDGVRRAVQPARRHPLRRARPAHPRERSVPTTQGAHVVSMRVGDESGRARAEAIDPALLATGPGRHAPGRQRVARRVAPLPPPHARHGRARVPRVHVPRLLRRRALRAGPEPPAPARADVGSVGRPLVRHRRAEPRHRSRGCCTAGRSR